MESNKLGNAVWDLLHPKKKEPGIKDFAEPMPASVNDVSAQDKETLGKRDTQPMTAVTPEDGKVY